MLFMHISSPDTKKNHPETHAGTAPGGRLFARPARRPDARHLPPAQARHSLPCEAGRLSPPPPLFYPHTPHHPKYYQSYSGSAYLFDLSGTQVAKLTASDGAAYDYFGSSVAISGSTVVVGGVWMGRDWGSAYLFDLSGTQVAKLTASDGAAKDYFGRSVAISGSTVVVGAGADDDNGADSGSAYLFSAA